MEEGLASRQALLLPACRAGLFVINASVCGNPKALARGLTVLCISPTQKARVGMVDNLGCHVGGQLGLSMAYLHQGWPRYEAQRLSSTISGQW